MCTIFVNNDRSLKKIEKGTEKYEKGARMENSREQGADDENVKGAGTVKDFPNRASAVTV